jgi:hypothetical protein
VAWNVNESQAKGLATGSRQLEMREANVDGDTAAFFFCQAVGVNPCQRLDQGGFSMVNVTRGPDNNGLHRETVYRKEWLGSCTGQDVKPG